MAIAPDQGIAPSVRQDGSMFRALLLALGLIGVPLAGATAQPGERAPGHVAARAFATAPASLAMAVEPGDNADENLAIAARIAREAAARQIAVDPQARLVLRFDSEVRANFRARRQTFSREGGGLSDPDIGMPAPPDTDDQVANVLSSCGAGAVGARPLPQAGYGRCLRYVINAMLDDRSSGRRLWQGHVSYDAAAPDRTAMFVALAPVLVEQIGRTEQEKSFRLD
jgi:hypothetical protein